MLGTGGGGGDGGGSVSRIFSSGVDRRLRTQNGINQLQQALKCPRCDSLNTKFCYYNNYNLAQPRHFCKGCRRYWTKGGVLRKVPVGGGCRKAKRTAKPRHSTTPSVVVSATESGAADDADDDDKDKNKDNSSSESSSLTATGEAASGNTSLNSAPISFNFAPECNFFASFIDQASECAGSMFPEIGGLMTSTEDMMTSSREVGFTVGEISTFVNEKDDEERKRCDQDQTAQIDPGFFDLTGTVDQTYWTQSQWPDHADHSAFHYLP